MKDNNLRRLNEIVSILKDSQLLREITPKKLCDTLEKLGPTFIKIGQLMSLRVDLIPTNYCEELSKLRSNVTPLPYEEIIEILNDNYSNYSDVFLKIDPIPIGSASIAQVHKAILKENNEEVVIKIKRPNIKRILENDIKLFKKAVSILHLNKIVKVIDLNEVLNQLYDVTEEETNFVIEKERIIEFRKINTGSCYIYTPYVYDKYCSNDVIVMEYIEGIKINDVDCLVKNNYNLSVLADLLSENYITQALDSGFFHADPHPDNILIRDDNIVYIDFGMVGKLTNKNKNLLKECIRAIILKNYKEVTRILVSMSSTLDEINYSVLQRDVTNILEEFADLDLNSINTSKFVFEMFKMLKDNNLKLDYDVTMLIRGIVTIEPILKDLNPETSLLKVLMLSNEFQISKRFDYDSLINKFRKVGRNLDEMIDIPTELSYLLKSINNGESKFKIELSDSVKHVDKLENLVHELILGFLDGCLVIAVVLINDYKIKSLLISFIVVITIWLLIKMIIDFVHRGY